MADKKDQDPNPPSEDPTFRQLQKRAMAEKPFPGFNSESVFEKQKLEELQSKDYYSVLRALKAETSTISQVPDHTKTDKTDSQNKKMMLEELQKQACYDVLHAFLAESPTLSSERISIMQELLDEFNISHNAHIAIDDDKIKTDPLREEPECRPLPLDFKFRPTDCEMANLFLKKKALGLPKPMGTPTIPEESHDIIFSEHPRDLPGYPKEKHWYFYCRKPNGQFTTNPRNLWTRVGEDTTVLDRQEYGVGIKRSFTLIEEEEEESNDIYLPDEEEPPKEEWFMDEISLLPTVADTDLVMCHVIRKKKKKKKKKKEEEEEEEEEEESVVFESDSESEYESD